MNASGRPADWIVPSWATPVHVRALFTTRNGGVSTGLYAGAAGGGMNLGLNSGDVADAVLANRARLRALLPDEPRWLRQVHGADVVDAETVSGAPGADASVATSAAVVCCVTVADCLPVLLADTQGRAVAAAHAGWRGLAAGVLQATVARLRARIGDPTAQVLATIGPAIGPQRFEVGAEVLAALRVRLPESSACFVPLGGGKYLADLPQLARQALAQVGVTGVSGAADCTARDAQRFYSHRRDGVTGRQAGLIWLAR